jgi:hypothetical protein
MLEPAYLLTIVAVMVIAGGAWLMVRARRSV